MNKRFITLVGSIFILLALVTPALAAVPGNRGYYVDGTGYDGLHAIVSTMVGTGNPPAFAFATKSPDVHQYWASSQIRPHNSCVSADVAHERVTGSSTTTHKFLIGAWCNGSQAGTFTQDMTDSTWRGKYVRTNSYNDTGTSFQDEVIEMRVILADVPTNKWSVYLYNFNTSAYDFIASVAGTLTDSGGSFVDIGDGGETQNTTMSCPTLYPWGIMQIRAIQKRVSGAWSNIASGDITGNITNTWPCLTTNNYQERRTLPYQFKIEPYGVAY